MQYVIYFLVATPLVLGWILYEGATVPPQPPLFVTGLERLSPQPVVTASGKDPAHNKLARNEASASD